MRPITCRSSEHFPAHMCAQQRHIKQKQRFHMHTRFWLSLIQHFRRSTVKSVYSCPCNSETNIIWVSDHLHSLLFDSHAFRKTVMPLQNDLHSWGWAHFGLWLHGHCCICHSTGFSHNIFYSSDWLFRSNKHITYKSTHNYNSVENVKVKGCNKTAKTLSDPSEILEYATMLLFSLRDY